MGITVLVFVLFGGLDIAADSSYNKNSCLMFIFKKDDRGEYLWGQAKVM